MTGLRLFRIVCLSLCLICGGIRAFGQAIGPDEVFGKTLRPFLASNCQSCHNAAVVAGKLDLEAASAKAAPLEDRSLWAAVLRRVEAGEMPPAGTPRPNADELHSFLAALRSAMGVTAERNEPQPGRVTARRLNRTEYNNTIQGLLGVDLRPADDFPQDDSGYGFDNIADVLSVSPALTEMYLKAAEASVHRALFGVGKVAPTAVLHQPPYRAALDGGDASRLGAPPPTV